LVGIDEAGYGPLLGPLVVSSCAFSMPDEMVADDLWDLLKKSVSKHKRALGGRLLITDSKKAYTSSSGVKHLRRATLTLLRCLGADVSTIGRLLAALCPDAVERLAGYAWHSGIDTAELGADADDVAIAAKVFADDLARHGMRAVGLRSRCLDVAYYNRMVDNVRNKAEVLFSQTCTLIQSALDTSGDDLLQVLIDRQGGRVHYRRTLLRMFPRMELTILKESPRTSSYELRDSRRRMRLHFAVGADEGYLPVSLASMCSKYLRETLMACLNRYFSQFGADIRPTAGYWEDGLRFVNDLKAHLPHVAYDPDQLIRSR